MVRTLVARGLSGALAPWYHRFRRALAQPQEAQARVRQRITRLMARTDYGRQLGLTGGEDHATFTARVPVVEYDELEPWIARQMDTGLPVLTPDPVVVYEETSGSSGHRKYIPYSRPLLRDFNRAFVIWAADMLAFGPRFSTARMFFSVSPVCRTRSATATGVPIGLDDDTQYLSPGVRRLVAGRLVVPPGSAMQLNAGDFRRVLLCRLLGTEDLEVVSIWSPTYLLALMELFARERDSILTALARGWLEVGDRRIPVPRVSPRRIAQLARIATDWSAVWPNLTLVSAWTDASSAPFARALGAHLPGVLLQGKGLLSTEAPVTVPLHGAPAPVPLVDRVYLELERDDGRVQPLSEVPDEGEGSLIVSQRGGLMRYRTHDRVRVEGRYRATPCVRFIGRDNLIGDLVGEKLHPHVVEAAIQAVCGDDVFGIVFPDPSATAQPRYQCAVESTGGTAPSAVASALDARLADAVQYRQARVLHQLAPVAVTVVPDLRARYESVMLDRGMSLGSIKFTAMLPADVAAAAHAAITSPHRGSRVPSRSLTAAKPAKARGPLER